MPSASPHRFSMVSPSARKRRHEGDDESTHRPLGSPFGTSEHLLSTINHNERYVIPTSRGGTSLLSFPRKVISVPVAKKFRHLDTTHCEQQQPPNSHYTCDSPIQATALSPSQPSHFSHAHPDLTTTPSACISPQPRPVARTASSSLLSPCHICHRKPTRKSDLDSYADCMGCRERTCFVCLRACQGWLSASHGSGPGRTESKEQDLSASLTMQDVDDAVVIPDDVPIHTNWEQQPYQRPKQGEGGGGGTPSPSWSGRGHRAVICSRCCIERGSEGDVVCLGCLAGMKGT
ncbi:hypothetical protein F5Y17DRAFT_360805 [Xylariaceae sp. FL0594]|nr:hypothetical protein F5Y17DRAFT_360805 [Xylariaceae sp. FL0594]